MAPVTDARPRGDASAALARIDVALRDATEREPRPGLLTGYGGAALFHAYGFLWTRDERHLDQVHRVIARTLDALAGEHPGPSFSSGLAGIAWSLQHLVRIGLLEPDDSADVFAQVDDLLAQAMDAALAEGRHDFLHEGLGIALYFVERLPDPAALVQLERAAARLASTAADDGRGGLRWRDRFTRRGRDGGAACYNLGLAHGVPAIIALLALIHDHGVARARIAPLLRGATRWLRVTRLPGTTGAASLFPILVDADHRPVGPARSRLGWCYGDLAVATALGRAGAALGDRDLVDEAREILRHTCAHRTAENGAIEDASLCHGSMGVSHILRRAARDGDHAELGAGADRWLDHTLSLGAGPGHSAGFRFWREDHFIDCFDLLQGITGIGLGLLAAVDRETPPAWDRCLLLS